ncbi:MAG: hypothetical protein EXS25_03805 [Pedosphaera sp.]|nr:hypothetical protein [Pedosphaera sp.]
MKLLSRDTDRAVWLLYTKEREVLLFLVRTGERRRGANPATDSDGLGIEDLAETELEAWLREHRNSTSKEITDRLKDPVSCVRGRGGHAWTLVNGQSELLLQVLNELRISAWKRLGQPPEVLPDPLPALGTEDYIDCWIMETASIFQSQLLQGLESE